MSFLGWMALAGGLLLVMTLASALVHRLPISTSLIYLCLGWVLGPGGFGVLHVDLAAATPWLLRLVEGALIVSLFVGGLKLRLPLRHPAWRAAVRLAGPLMLLTIAFVAALGHLALGLDLPTALLLGAVLAPTDPVLAGAVTVNDASDHDRMRYGLSGEAGLNDGMAFPFVVLALLWMQHGRPDAWLGAWALENLLWGVPAALVIGYLMGQAGGHVGMWLRHRHTEVGAPGDFLALSLIALSYVTAQLVHAWGFLAVFAAGVGMRQAEVRIVTRAASGQDPTVGAPTGRVPEPAAPRSTAESASSPVAHPPAEDLVARPVATQGQAHPAMAAGTVVAEVLSFGNTIERLLEVMLVVLVGIALGSYWDWRAVPLALALMLLGRPLLAQLCLARTPTTAAQRWLMGLFGFRGIGSVYYLCYAIDEGVRGPRALDLAGLTLTVVAISIALHGLMVTPLMDRYEWALAKSRRAAEAPGSTPARM